MPAHHYYIDIPGKPRPLRVPSVTTVIKQLGWGGNDALVNWANRAGLDGMTCEEARLTACTVGTVVHAMIEADVRGHAELDISKLPADVVEQARNAFEAYAGWKRRYGVQPVAAELSLVSQLPVDSGHACYIGGTLDLAMVEDELAILDYKTGWLGEGAIVQICGYAHLLEHGQRCCCKRCLSLEPWVRPDGKVESFHLLGLGKEDGSFHHHRWPRESPAITAGFRSLWRARQQYDDQKVLKGAL